MNHKKLEFADSVLSFTHSWQDACSFFIKPVP